MKTKFTNFRNWILAGCLMAVCSMAEAAIIYHDEDPDVPQTQTTEGEQTFDVDMDDDGTVDFTFTIKTGDTTLSTNIGPVSGNGSGVVIEPGSGNFTSEESSSPISTVKAHNADDDITSALTWQSEISLLKFNGNATSPAIIAGPVDYGNFTGSVDKYIGVKFLIGANTHYGWIRVAVSSTGDSYTVKDWAYEDTPDMDIDAGELAPTAVNKQLLATTTIVNKNNSIEVTFANPLSGTINAINMSGSMVGSVTFNGSSCVLNMQGKPSGIYNLLFETSSGEFAKKIYVE